MDEGAPLLDQREMLRDASGRDIECLASRVPLRDQAGNLIGMLSGCSSRSWTLRPSERGGMRSSSTLGRSATSRDTLSPARDALACTDGDAVP